MQSRVSRSGEGRSAALEVLEMRGKRDAAGCSATCMSLNDIGFPLGLSQFVTIAVQSFEARDWPSG